MSDSVVPLLVCMITCILNFMYISQAEAVLKSVVDSSIRTLPTIPGLGKSQVPRKSLKLEPICLDYLNVMWSFIISIVTGSFHLITVASIPVFNKVAFATTK